jgi:predicted nucleic acid-binding protein
MEYAIADTGIWYAMFDARDQHARDIKEKVDILSLYRIVMPWPTVYETLRTRLVRNKYAMQRFEDYLKRPNIEYLDDSQYREAALELAFYSALRKSRPLSMVDCLIRLLLDDIDVKVSCLATFNHADFIDLCNKRRIELI